MIAVWLKIGWVDFDFTFLEIEPRFVISLSFSGGTFAFVE